VDKTKGYIRAGTSMAGMFMVDFSVSNSGVMPFYFATRGFDNFFG